MMLSRMLTWAERVVVRAIAKRIAEAVEGYSGEEVEPLDLEEPKQIAGPAPRKAR
jgi:hypothetical protein